MHDFENTSYTLLQRALDLGDDEAWERMVAHYRRFICYVLHKLHVAPADVDDLCQQVIILLLRDLKNYDRSRASFRGWLSILIRNEAVTFFRKQASQRRRVDGLKNQSACDSLGQPAEIDGLIQREWAAYITNQAMDRVRGFFEGKAIEAFELGVDGLSAAEISVQTGLTVSSVYTLRKRVKKRLYMEVMDLKADLEP